MSVNGSYRQEAIPLVDRNRFGVSSGRGTHSGWYIIPAQLRLDETV
jgi:hypothetical protein